MSSRIKFALKIYGLSLVPFSIAVIILSDSKNEIWWTLIWVYTYAILWVGVPAYFIRLIYEFFTSPLEKNKKRTDLPNK